MSEFKTNFISVVIPVYKSENILPELYARLQNVFNEMKMDYEIIFINDCSPDNSWKFLTQVANENLKIKPILLRKNVGYECAIMSGLRFVKGDYIVIMDDDLQHSPEDIPKLIKEIEKGHDVVYAYFSNKKQSLIKNLGSWFNGKVAQIVINKPKEIYLSPFKILKKEIVDGIINYRGPFPYLDGLIFRTTQSIHQIPIAHHKRKTGTGSHNIYRSLKIWLNLVTGFSILPLNISVVIGFFISASALTISLGLIIWRIFLGGEAPEGWTSVLLSVVFIGGIQLTVLGIIGEYIGRIYMNINYQSQFTIKKKLNIK